ncbi:MAG: acetyl-CoA decarbonylase/synthase complex subunit delta [Deltaproteobacteria bacterium]|nr:acetyl-CoA decarbonylase/synthase complex subunit delta [Deltaproteobacteria bacterium]
MGFEIVKEKYAGSVRPITLGKGDKAVTVGGESCYPMYLFEGDMPNKPKIAMEVWDMEPTEWPAWAKKPFEDVLSDPAAWAKKCQTEYGADLIVLQLKSADPNDKDASPEDVAKTVKSVLDAIDIPLVIWGTANGQKDEAVLKKVSEVCDGENLVLGPVEDNNHKGIGASALGYKHTVISSSPIDVNLAKQVNILLENLGVPPERIVVDPTTGGLGYGMEYSYSVMERLRMAALAQGDDKLQYPVVNNLGNEIWRCKEAGLNAEDAPELGDPERRTVMMEAVGAVCYLLAGSDLLIMRHPEAVRLARSFIDLIMDGGSAAEVAPIEKRLDDVDIDYAAMAPAPDLTIEEEKKAAPAKKAAPSAEKKAAPEKKAPTKKAAPKPAAEAKSAPAPEVKPAPKDDAVEKAAAEAAARAAAEAEAASKAKVAADAEAKAAADAEAKAKAEAAAKAKVEADALARREAEEDALRQKRAKEREEQAQKRMAAAGKSEISKTPAAVQKTELDEIIERLDRIHRKGA